jgi:hypothetical protein
VEKLLSEIGMIEKMAANIAASLRRRHRHRCGGAADGVGR